MFFEKKKWVNRIKIHDEVATSLAPNVLLRKFSLNSSITPIFTICEHTLLYLCSKWTIIQRYSRFTIFFFFFFSIETTRRSVGFLLIVENDFTDCCDPIFGAREMSNVFHKQDLNIGDKLNCT